MYQNKVTSSLAAIHGQVTKHTTVKWPIKLLQTIDVMTFIFSDVKFDFALMYMHMHMNYFLSRSLSRAT